MSDKLVYYPLNKNFDAKMVTRKGVTHIELRRTFTGAQMLVLVALNGYNKDAYESIDGPDGKTQRYWQSYMSTKGIQVRLSLNGPARMSFEDFLEIRDEIENAFQALIRWEQDGLINA